MKDNNTVKGAVLLISASLLFCAMAGMIKYASGIDPYKMALFRFVIGLGLLGTAALSGKIKLVFSHGPLLFLRGLIGSLAVFVLYLSIPKLGLAKATVICYSFPVFASIFGFIFLKERVSIVNGVAILLSFVGIYLLTIKGGSDSIFAGIGKYEMISIFGAVFGGGAIVIIKKLHDTDSSYAIFFAQCVIGMWIMIVPASVATSTIDYSGVMLLLGIGITAAIGQLLMTQGYNYVPVATGSLLGMLTPVLSYIIGITVFNEPISTYSIIGATIVIGSCAVVLKARNKQ